MTERDYVEIAYKKYGKMVLNMREMCELIGKSYSSVSKKFGGKDAIPEDIILKNNLVPKWKEEEDGRRSWPIPCIVRWFFC